MNKKQFKKREIYSQESSTRRILIVKNLFKLNEHDNSLPKIK